LCTATFPNFGATWREEEEEAIFFCAVKESQK